MSVKCELCGKEFKNKAGLAGHMTIVHGKGTKPVDRPSDRWTDCEHVWKRLTVEQMRMIGPDGQSLGSHGYRHYCELCEEVR